MDMFRVSHTAGMTKKVCPTENFPHSWPFCKLLSNNVLGQCLVNSSHFLLLSMRAFGQFTPCAKRRRKVCFSSFSFSFFHRKKTKEEEEEAPFDAAAEEVKTKAKTWKEEEDEEELFLRSAWAGIPTKCCRA